MNKITEKEISLVTDKDIYFIDIVKAVSVKATCDRGKSGCVIVKNDSVVSTGYVDTPKNIPNCDEVGHLIKKVIHADGKETTHCFRTIHAEQNAICNAVKNGISLIGTTLYCTMTPCRVCAMLIINSGITRVVCEKKYHAGSESEEMFSLTGVELCFVNNEVIKY